MDLYFCWSTSLLTNQRPTENLFMIMMRPCLDSTKFGHLNTDCAMNVGAEECSKIAYLLIRKNHRCSRDWCGVER